MTEAMKSPFTGVPTGPGQESRAQEQVLRLMTIGRHGDAPDPGPDPGPAGLPELVSIDLCELSAAMLELHRPDVVLSPLVGRGFDVFDVAAALTAAGFRGRLRAAAAHIPDPQLVRREVAAAFPGLDFDVLVLDSVRAGQ